MAEGSQIPLEMTRGVRPGPTNVRVLVKMGLYDIPDPTLQPYTYHGALEDSRTQHKKWEDKPKLPQK